MNHKTIAERMAAIKQGCADIQFNISRLENELQQAKANLEVNRGALADCEYWLQQTAQTVELAEQQEDTNG